MSSAKSLVWKYFSKLNKEESKCQVGNCTEIIKCKGGTTSAMRNHLKKHKIEIGAMKIDNNDIEAGPYKKSRIDNNNSASTGISKYINRESLGGVLAKCAAKDGFSFQSIVNSDAIKGYVKIRNFDMPKSAKTVRKLVMDFYFEKKKELQIEIKQMMAKGFKFSITVDEWTDISMKRYMNVTLYAVKNHFYLGLIPIQGSCNFQKTVDVIAERLQEFNIDFGKDVVASTHDGAAVMVKYGATIEAYSQLCYNHGIHLAIIDVFYKKKDLVENEETFEDLYSENEDEDNDEESNGENFYNDGNINFETETFSTVYVRSDIGNVLKKVRKTITFFKKSAVRSSVLQKHILKQGEKPLKLLLDCKTRWNSLIPMISRFLKLYNYINMALSELGAELFQEENLEILKEVLLVLEPMELAVIELSKNDSNLLIADGVFIHLFKKLKELNTSLSKEMLEVLERRINERRQINLVSFLYFLQNGKYPTNSNEINDSQIKYSSKSAIKSLASKIWDRLFTKISDELGTDDEIEIQEVSGEKDLGAISAYTEMQKTINSLISVPQERSFKHIQDELKKFEITGLRTERVQKLLDALMTIQPTSTASERAFSVAGNFKTIIRSQLNEETLNGLVFLKYYFLKN